ncbi:MAG: cyclic nucleotide-binding domain-containing protein, partial [Rhodocyclaceae bacterium]
MDKKTNRPSLDRLLHPDVLGRISLLAGLDRRELEELATQMQVRRYRKGELVLIKGSASDALMFLLAGSLQAVDYTEDGKEIGLNLFTAGSFFGELSLIDGLPRSATIVAIEDSAVAFLPRRHALVLISGRPAVAEQM